MPRTILAAVDAAPLLAEIGRQLQTVNLEAVVIGKMKAAARQSSQAK